MDGSADYGTLNALATHMINRPLIERHWDDLLRLAGSLKLGLVPAADLIRTLQTNDRPTRLAQALAELGRIIKTEYLLAFIDDEAYRRRILIQLNRGESATGSPAWSSMAFAGNCASATAKASRTSLAPSAWWSTSSSCGTPSIWMPPWPNCAPKASRSATRMSPA